MHNCGGASDELKTKQKDRDHQQHNCSTDGLMTSLAGTCWTEAASDCLAAGRRRRWSG